jgi:hypothetical protein
VGEEEEDGNKLGSRWLRFGLVALFSLSLGMDYLRSGINELLSAGLVVDLESDGRRRRRLDDHGRAHRVSACSDSFTASKRGYFGALLFSGCSNPPLVNSSTVQSFAQTIPSNYFCSVSLFFYYGFCGRVLLFIDDDGDFGTSKCPVFRPPLTKMQAKFLNFTQTTRNKSKAQRVTTLS